MDSLNNALILLTSKYFILFFKKKDKHTEYNILFVIYNKHFTNVDLKEDTQKDAH